MNEREQSEPGESVAWIRAAQAGDLAAFERLFARYYPTVKRIVRGRIGEELRRSYESDDVLHESLIEAVRSFPSFELREEAGLVDWLAAVVENRIRSLIRRGRAKKRDRECEIALDHIKSSIQSGSLRLELEDDSPGPSEQAAQREQIALLAECMQELEPQHREVLLLRLYRSLSWEEVARELGGTTPDAARMRFSKAQVELSKRIRRRTGQRDAE